MLVLELYIFLNFFIINIITFIFFHIYFYFFHIYITTYILKKCIYIYIYIYIYIHTHTHTHTHTHRQLILGNAELEKYRIIYVFKCIIA